MDKEKIEQILVEYGVSFTDALADRLLEEFKPCEDAINRQEVIDGIEELKKSPWATDKRGTGFEYLITEALDVVAELCVKQAPPVNPQESKMGWTPVSEGLPELNRPLLVTAYHRVCYAHMISESGNYGYPVFRLHEIKDSNRGWVNETISHEPYSKGRIDAWMYIDIPEPYKAESEDKEDAE